MDNFYTKTKCDCCGDSLDSGRIMSMYSNECFCMKCKSEEMKKSDYEDAVKKDSEGHVGKQKFRCCICGKEKVIVNLSKPLKSFFELNIII